MPDPFLIEGPAAISFSGGRTSAYMLRRCLDAGLPPDAHVCFANTGKERSETLDFVHEVEVRWNIPVVWLEYDAAAEHLTRIADHPTASRAGEPFAALIAKRAYLPNPVTRFCTEELKIRRISAYMHHVRGYDCWTNVVGIRADEPHRVARLRHRNAMGKDRWDVVLPLADAGITHDDVRAFWRDQPFDLQLREWEGNCDLCYLKATAKRVRVMQDRPDLAAWWIQQEERLGKRFRINTPSYAELVQLSRQPRLPFPCAVDAADELGDCFCHD